MNAHGSNSSSYSSSESRNSASSSSVSTVNPLRMASNSARLRFLPAPKEVDGASSSSSSSSSSRTSSRPLSCFGGVNARSLAYFFDPSLEAVRVLLAAPSSSSSATAMAATPFFSATSVPERNENIGEKMESMNRFLPLLIIPPPCSAAVAAFIIFVVVVVFRLVVLVLAASTSSSPSSLALPPISTSSSDTAACFDELFAAAANLNCLPPPPFSSFSLLLFLLFLNELVIKLESASAFFVGGGVVSFFALVAFTNGVEAVFVPKLLFALFAFASSPCKNSLFSTSSSELIVSALSLFAEDALLAMDFSMDIAELMIPDPEDNRRWM
mmetsp:Transcript_1879/g.6007  ORF Transcript_1879/g.6007 Transcript_1879/m.6007 type:complete len:327 (+) Transcript_1879:849-1829(+)